MKAGRRVGDAVYLGRWDNDSVEWDAERTTRLGGSEIAAVLGLSPWASEYSLWWRKAGKLAPIPDRPELRWGRLLEPAVAKVWAEHHPDRRMLRTGTWVHHRRDWQLANPDRLVIGGGGYELLEIKTAHDDFGWGQPGTDAVPPYYLTQARWYLSVFGAKRCYFAVLFGGTDYQEYVVEQDPDDEALLLDKGWTFIASLRHNTPPPIDGHDATYITVRELHPEIGDYDFDLTPEQAEEYRAAAVALKTAKTDVSRLNAQLTVDMDGGRRARIDGRTIAYRTAVKDGNPYVRAVNKLHEWPPITTTPSTTSESEQSA